MKLFYSQSNKIYERDNVTLGSLAFPGSTVLKWPLE
jgi:hypothetical protein